MKLFSSLIKSKSRKDLFLLFFSNPQKKYYLHELARLTGNPAQNLRRDLVPLLKDGLFIKESLGNLTFYKLNQTYPLYHELQSIISKTIGIESLIRSSLQELTGIQAAFIFGSYARGEEGIHSDIDLFILGEPDKDTLIQKILGVEKKINREINYIFYSKKTFDKKKKEHNSFIESIYRNPKIFLIGEKNSL